MKNIKKRNMKNTIKFFAFAILFFGLTATTFAQVSATANATATIVTPIAISKTVDMNFGNIAVLTGTGGTVVLAPAGTRTKTGGVTLPVTAGTITAASFTVTGASGYTYSITLPGSATTISYLTNNMTVDTWTSNPVTTGTLTSGTQTLNVGATLNVSAGQVAGVYTSGTPFTVTVNYN